MRIDPGRTAAAQQQQRASNQQADAEPEATVVGGTDEGQQYRPGQLAEGVAGAVQRDQPATPLLHRQLVDPAFPEDEHHGELHADQQAQQQPYRVALQQRQQADGGCPGEQAQLHQPRRADARGEAPGDHRAEQHAHCRRAGHHADGETAVAPALQAQRDQRHGQAKGEADADDCGTDGEIASPTHCDSPVGTPEALPGRADISGARSTAAGLPEGNPAAGVARESRPGRADLGDQSLIQVAFSSVYLSKACSDLSRPLPDCLKPPNGAVMSPPSYWLTQT